MSMITENTVVIRKSEYESFDKYIESLKDEGMVSGVHNSYDCELKGDYVIYTFDCNGDGCLLMEEFEGEIFGVETNYLDGEPPYTQILENGRLVDIEKPLGKILKKNLDKEDFAKIKNMIAYSSYDKSAEIGG